MISILLNTIITEQCINIICNNIYLNTISNIKLNKLYNKITVKYTNKDLFIYHKATIIYKDDIFKILYKYVEIKYNNITAFNLDINFYKIYNNKQILSIDYDNLIIYLNQKESFLILYKIISVE